MLIRRKEFCARAGTEQHLSGRPEGKKIFCKFHPREDMEWSVFDGCTILERTIGAESLYLSLIPQKEVISIVGIKSAGLMSAKKMGFEVVTLFNECGEANPNLVKFFTNLGCKFAL